MRTRRRTATECIRGADAGRHDKAPSPCEGVGACLCAGFSVRLAAPASEEVAAVVPAVVVAVADAHGDQVDLGAARVVDLVAPARVLLGHEGGVALVAAVGELDVREAGAVEDLPGLRDRAAPDVRDLGLVFRLADLDVEIG